MDNKYIDRQLAKAIENAYKYFPVITVTGPRQSGKTTMIRNEFPQLHYYSLENIDVRNFAAEDPIAFLNSYPEGMILDEVHNVPDLLSYIQGIVDECPEKRFVLSGSSQFAMLQKVTQSLAGRAAVFELLPFSYSEVKDLVDDESLDKLLFDGFYPAVCSGKNRPELLYPSYVKTYLDRDVRNLLNVKDMMQFHTFIRLCAGRIGSLFNASELAGEVGVSVNTISSWLSVLEASYIVMLLHPYHVHAGKRLTKTPKLYFMDTGLACYLLDIESSAQLSRDKMRSHLFENFVVTEALKHRYNAGKDSNLYFYRDSNCNEIDLLLRRASGFSAIEVKSAMTYNPEFAKVLKSVDKWMPGMISDRTVLYAGSFENTVGDINILNYKHLSEILG